jgi:hypothetical protein
MSHFDQEEEKPASPVRSRIWLDISYDILAGGFSLPPELRIIQVKSNDEEAVVSLLVEGRGIKHKYAWRPGCAVPHLAVYAPFDLPVQLLSK